MRLLTIMATGTPTTKLRFVLNALVMFLFLFVHAASASDARAQKKAEKSEDGRLAIRTNKSNLVISINGQPVSPQAKNKDGIMRFIVPAGNNTIEVLLPDSNDHWEKEINIPAGRMICMRLTHRAAIINKGDSKTDPPRAQGAEVKMVEYITDSYQECVNDESLFDGLLDLKTNPDGYPILIDGKDYGVTYNPAQSIILPAGKHTLEVLFPNRRWTQQIDIEGGMNTCVCLNYISHIISTSEPEVAPNTASSPKGQEIVAEVTAEPCECTMATRLPNVTKEWKKVKKIKKH